MRMSPSNPRLRRPQFVPTAPQLRAVREIARHYKETAGQNRYRYLEELMFMKRLSDVGFNETVSMIIIARCQSLPVNC